MNKGAKKQVNTKGVSFEEKFEGNETIDPGFSTDFFQVPSDIMQELDEKGLVPRWVDTKAMERNSGFHLKGWRPYKTDKVKSDVDFLYGKSPDGYLRRGELVLAVKTKEEVSKHRAYLDAEAKRKSVSNVKKKGKEAFKEYLRQTGMTDYFKEDSNYE